MTSTSNDARQGDRLDGDAAAMADGLDAIVAYRGDVTIVRRDAPDEPLEGYVFDCERRDPVDDTVVRLLPKSGASRVSIPLGAIASIEVSGRDTAAGKSFETWVRKYAEKKLAGLPANIDPDDGE